MSYADYKYLPCICGSVLPRIGSWWPVLRARLREGAWSRASVPCYAISSHDLITAGQSQTPKSKISNRTGAASAGTRSIV